MPAGLRFFACSFVFLMAAPAPAHDPAAAIPGFSAAGAAAQLEIEGRILPLLDAAGTARHFRFLTEDWSAAADRLRSAVDGALTSGGDNSRFRSLNGILLGIERLLLSDEGIPDRPWFKHVLYAPRYTYAAMSLPGVTEAIEAEDWQRAGQQLELLAGHLSRVATALEKAVAEVPMS